MSKHRFYFKPLQCIKNYISCCMWIGVLKLGADCTGGQLPSLCIRMFSRKILKYNNDLTKSKTSTLVIMQAQTSRLLGWPSPNGSSIYRFSLNQNWVYSKVFKWLCHFLKCLYLFFIFVFITSDSLRCFAYTTMRAEPDINENVRPRKVIQSASDML